MNPNKDLHQHLYPGTEKLRVLHIGNIANNGYNIANLFNQAGVKSDLIIGPYYHFAGCPEWEDAEFDGDIGDQFHPSWHKVKITNGFVRPKWAAQGPWELCIRYLLHRNRGQSIRARICWEWLKVCQRTSDNHAVGPVAVSELIGSPYKVVKHSFNRLINGQFRQALSGLYRFLAGVFVRLRFSLSYFVRYRIPRAIYMSRYWVNYGYAHTKYWMRYFVFRGAKFLLLSNSLTTPLFYKLRTIRRRLFLNSNQVSQVEKTQNEREQSSDSTNTFESESEKALAVTEVFTDATSTDSVEGNVGLEEHNKYGIDVDLAAYKALSDQLAPLFEYYDVIVGYSTDGIWPLLAGKNYVAYEHGTIRTLPFEDSDAGKICQLVYKKADHVIISNFDNNVSAERMGLTKYTCIPHYINEMEVAEESGLKLRASLLEEKDSDFIVYNPSRQHWSAREDRGWEKANDMLITGFANFVEGVAPKALLVMTHWGDSLEQSKILVDTLDISDNVIWVDPVPHKGMIQYIHASDVVSDQFLLDTFGGIPAKAFLHKRAVLSAFEPKVHDWCFDDMPPFLPANGVPEIVTSLTRCYKDRDYYESLQVQSKVWYQKQHSNAVLLSKMSKILSDIAKNVD